jgi:23S rRNA maturation mini-RNase III
MKNYNKTQDSEEQSDISTSDNIMNDEENSNIKNNRNEISTNEKKETSNSSLQTSTTLHIPLRRMRRISQVFISFLI